MSTIRNLLALVGLLVVAALIWGFVQFGHLIGGAMELHPKADQVYLQMGQRLLQTGSSAAAMTWRVKVEDGITFDDVQTTMRMVANEHNIKNVGELPLSQQVEAMSGKPYRTMKIFMFCNAMTAAMMMDYDDAFAAFLPCRITVVEDLQGGLWLYAMDMEAMIYGGRPLPADLHDEALKVQHIIRDIMERAASGSF